jgi:hypothetical protein
MLGGVAAVALIPLSASALQVTVAAGGSLYEITMFPGNYNSNPLLLQSNPWWGSQSLSQEFAAAVGNGLGLTPGIPLPSIGTAGVGPLFAYATGRTGFFNIPVTRSSLYYEVGSLTSGVVSNFPQTRSGFGSTLIPYAVAREVPAPLPLLGVAAAFSFSRRLRSRIRRSATVDS